MSDDIHLGSERDEATAEPRDRIFLRDYVVEADIGAFQSERGVMQRLRFDVAVEIGPQTSPPDDDVDRILSYDTIREAIAAELATERFSLLETLAERVTNRLLMKPQAARVFMRVEKPDRGSGSPGIEITRSRVWLPGREPVATGKEDTPRPLVIHLPNSAIASDNLSGWIDSLNEAGKPVILCVGAPDGSLPHSRVQASARRIELLAIEQNAWVLAGRDRRCVVAGTRTELDWGARNGQISVLAPTRLVLDSPGGDSVDTRDSRALAAWFANLIGAEGTITVDEEAMVAVSSRRANSG